MNPIVQALAAAGYKFAEADQATLESAAAKLADPEVNKVVGALAAALPTTGIAGLVDGGLKAALVAAEPSLDGIVNNEIDAVYAAIENGLKNLAGSQA